MQSHVSFFETFKMLRHHRKLADLRDLSSMENKFAKAMVYFSIVVVALYLMMLSIPFAMIVNESNSITSAELLAEMLPFMMALDFAMRFIAQQTPAQIVRPYLLLPISKHYCIDTFVLTSIFSWGNAVWLAMVLPYALMSMLFSYGCLTTLMAIMLVLVTAAANSQWYSIVRTLVNGSFVWWLLPLAVYALMAMPLYLGANPGLDQFDAVYSPVGAALDSHNPMPLVSALALLASLTGINCKLQYKYMMREVTQTEKKEVVRSVNRFDFLERYGEIGPFLQMEIKLLTRNMNPRKAFFAGIGTMLMISVIIIASDIYDSTVMTNFWGLYNFVLLCSTILIRIMGYEGNYIDCLLVRRENILTLLRAKYIFYSILLVLPFLLMLPVVVSGKWHIYMLVSYGVFTMGFQYFMLFQTAVYNRQTIPLNTKLTSKGGLDGNYIQMVLIAIIFLVPNVIVGVLQTFCNDNTAYTVMLLIGIGFILTHKLWLRNIYNRMMARKYRNLESFMASR